jgi:hypothetical protein
MKPLGGKSYGSIPHLPGSRLGAGDHHCHDGQAIIATMKTRDKHDRVIVTEKLDGSNVCVANVGGSVMALTRSGYLARTSPYQMHHAFADFAMARDWSGLPRDHRISGEWMHTAHGTIYIGVAPLVAFDVIDGAGKRLPYDAARETIASLGLTAAHVISDGPAMSVDAAMDALGVYGFHGAMEQVEGAVWRVERNGAFDFMAKFVRHDKQDGKYLETISGLPPVLMVTE